ncbi:type II CAAX prenyl endopeptidase Rce1 family protein [Methanobrevibacter sp.]|uniref:CPBP family glutamic-type intramembrane protease n=1 Tax=Methanobrevibacter sp. TaxID=66852 RepID=UPI00388D4896
MTVIDRFKFEDEGYDFPFYNKNPYIPKWGWVVLFVAFIVGTVLAVITQKLPFIILGCIVFIVPVLYFLKWDYKAIFRMPSRKDFVLIVALFVGYIVYGMVMEMILKQFGIVSPGTMGSESVTIMTLVTSIFSLMGEEFLKFIPFIFFLRVLYKFSNNRKLSVIISVAIIMVMFACFHAYNPTMLIFALFVQGFGSIFEFYGYIKTKNILVPYLTHLLTDEIIFIIALLGIPL